MHPQYKGPYSELIPKFEIPQITEEDIEKYAHLQFAVYELSVTGDKLPLVIAVHQDRLHVYNDVAELKYNAFNEDLYSQAISDCEILLRRLASGYVLWGFVNANGDVEVFHAWDFNRSIWLDVNQFEAMRDKISSKISLPRLHKRCMINDLLQSSKDLFIKSVNDPSIYFTVLNGS